MFYNIHTYGEFLKTPEKIATNILAGRLVSLERAGLILKEQHAESKAKFFYKLTPMGINLLPVMVEISIWGNKYFEISSDARALVKQAKHNKEGFMKLLSARLKKVNQPG